MLRSPRTLLWIAALAGATAVAAGAIGSHIVGDSDPVAARRFPIAVRYHQLHALSFLALSVGAAAGIRRWGPTTLLWLLGLLLFCGSLYGLALGGPAQLSKVAPSGGMALIVGWLALLWTRGPQKEAEAVSPPVG